MDDDKDQDDVDLCASGQAKIDRIYRQLEINLKRPSKLAICAKWFISIFCSCVLLTAVILSKFSVLELTSMMGNSTNCKYNDKKAKNNCENSYVALVMILLAPNIINLFRFMWTSISNDKKQWPPQSKMLMCVAVAIFEALGLCIFTFKVMTKEKNEVVILLMDCVFIAHIIANNIGECTGFSTNENKEKLWRCGTSIFAFLSIIGGLSLTFYASYNNLQNPNDFAYVIVSILCLSVSWLPWLNKTLIQTQFVSGSDTNDSQDAFITSYGEEQCDTTEENRSATEKPDEKDSRSPLACSNTNEEKITAGPKQETIEVYTHKMLIISSFTKILVIILFAIILQHAESGSNLAAIRRLKDGWMFGFDTSRDEGQQNMYVIINVILSFFGYIVGLYALKTRMNILGFVIPLLLATPLCFFLLYVPNICGDLDVPRRTKIFVQTICFDHRQTNDLQMLLPALLLLWIAQFLSTGFYVLSSLPYILQHEVKLFWMPMYNSLFMDQWMLLGRRTYMVEKHPKPTKNKKKETKVFICTTMYRETREEMKQLLESIARINEAKQYGQRNFESHVIVDGGIKNDVTGEKALQLLSLVIEVLKTNGLGTIAAAPYGLRLTWSLRPSNGQRCNRPMTFVVHLKDNKKVKNKKRWSQVMYMSYILDFLLKQDRTIAEEDSYILTTDADVKFSPDSVEALLDLMTRDTSVGAVCARTYPLGTGPLMWYQEFEYAIGHWLQKTAEHVLGTVLCAPGCFSVYRINAIRDILPIYATDVEKGMEFLTKDMGEDRWLCTLLVQSGWRIDYCAASCNYTNCPVEFDEFFTQRRRWIGSTIANSFLLMKEWNIVNKVNQDLSVWYLVYQSCLMGSTLLGPSTVILIVSSGLGYAWGVNMVLITCVQCVIVSIFCLVCLKGSKKNQLLMAKIITFIYAIIMVFVIIGTAEGTVHNVAGFQRTVNAKNSTGGPSEDVRMSVTTVYVLGVVTLFPLAGLIHLTEATSLLKGVAYLLCLPSTYILLIIYSFCNITDRSWGTRDKQQEDTVQTEAWYSWLSKEFKSIFTQYQRLRDGPDTNALIKDIPVKKEVPEDPPPFEEYASHTSLVNDDLSSLPDGMPNMRDILYQVRNEDDDESIITDISEDERRSLLTSASTSVSMASGLDSVYKKDYGRKHAYKILDVEDWVGQVELIPLFKMYGYDNTSFIATMTEADLERIGVKEKTQRNLLIRRINNLQQFPYTYAIPVNVYSWLRYIGLEEYAEQFTKCHITTTDDLEQLTSFTRKDIEQELKITKPAHIRRLLDAVAYLRSPTKEEKINLQIRQKLSNAPKYAIEMISPEDYSYWKQLIDCFLKPTSDGFSIEWSLKTQLEDLRDMWIFILFLINALWLILIITVALKVDLIIFGSSPVAFAFFLVFGILLLVQFGCMIIHRLSTLAHFLARTPYKFGDKYQTSWSYTSDDDIKALADVKKSLEECRKIELEMAEEAERNCEDTPLMRQFDDNYSNVDLK